MLLHVVGHNDKVAAQHLARARAAALRGQAGVYLCSGPCCLEGLTHGWSIPRTINLRHDTRTEKAKTASKLLQSPGMPLVDMQGDYGGQMIIGPGYL